MEDGFLSTKETRKLLGVTSQTLRNWVERGKVHAITSPSGVFLYNRKDIYNILGRSQDVPEKKKVAYCRVSSNKQQEDLDRQVEFFRTNYPDYQVVTDIGSGINWKRKGLTTLLESAMSGDIAEIMVAHRDRLCRFAFELVQFILESNGVKLTVLDNEVHQSENTELADDILSIVHVYSCRNMGKRRYKNTKDKNVSN